MSPLWLQSAVCGGCTMSLLSAKDPNVLDLLDTAGIRLPWHPALSQETGSEVRALLARIKGAEVALDILCVEGAVPRGPNGTGRSQMLAGTGRSLMGWGTGDADGTPGPVEPALVGAPVLPGEDTPLAVRHILRRFDPCTACTVH